MPDGYPSAEEHIDGAQRYERLAIAMLNGNDEDGVSWAAVLIFYSALHWVEAYFATQGLSSGTHKARMKRIRTSPQIASIHSDYRILRDRSEDVRYRLARLDHDSARILIDTHLSAIKRTIQSVLPKELNP